MFDVSCVLFARCWLLVVVGCLFCVDGCLMFAVRCSLLMVRWLFFDVY